jgi:hypothetical protein
MIASPKAIESTSSAVAIPILVGITGKRKTRLRDLGVSEAVVRGKLKRAFALLETLTPTSPKLLLCGMADGVDEIAARLIIEAVDLATGDRQFRNWSVIGLLPMPEQAFLDDFDAGAPWWFHQLDQTGRRYVRMMPLETLAKPQPVGTASSSPRARYTADELRRSPDRSNPARTDHYEQLGWVLAERSTVLIAVMAENEVPDRLGGTAQVVAHRLNGWRPDWPLADSQRVAAASSEFVVPPALATAMLGDVWLAPIGGDNEGPGSVDLRVLHSRQEGELPWPQPLQTSHPAADAKSPFKFVARLARTWWNSLFLDAEGDVLIRAGETFAWRASPGARLLKAIEAFNRRATSVTPRAPPAWDKSIAAHPAAPQQWSPIAAAERIRGTLSDVQVAHKKRIQASVVRLGLLAWLSIAVFELYTERPTWPDWLHNHLYFLPLLYVLIVIVAIVRLWRARRHSWASVTEDYRMVAEAMRVQIAWWQFGLTARHEWVDQRVLRYDAGEFQVLRQGLATLLDSLKLSHAALPAVKPGALLPAPVQGWIDDQIGYHHKTARVRKRNHGRFELFVWLCFGIALGLAAWLGLYAWHQHEKMQILGVLARAAEGSVFRWLIPLMLLAASGVLFLLAWIGRPGRTAGALAFRRAVGSLAAGIVGCSVIVWWWQFMHWQDQTLDNALVSAVLLFLAAAGTLKFAAETLATEAEAQGSAEAFAVYARARRALNQIDSDCAEKRIDPEEAARRREQIVRDLGRYALAETEAWLRSHRERPLHPAIGS